MQPNPGGHSCHAEGTQEGLGRRDVGIDLCDSLAVGGPVFTPTKVAEDHVAFLEVSILRLNHFTNAAALERLIDLKGRNVAVGVFHAASHARVDRHPLVLHQDLAVFDGAYLRRSHFEIRLLRHPIRTRHQFDLLGLYRFACCSAHDLFLVSQVNEFLVDKLQDAQVRKFATVAGVLDAAERQFSL